MRSLIKGNDLPKGNVKVSVIYIITNMSIAFYYTYLAQQLAWFGFNPEEIGTFLMVYVLMAVVSMPLMGYLTDNFIPDKTMMIINLVISGLSSIAFFTVEKTFLNVLIIIAVWSFSFKPIVNIVESYTYKLINEGDPIEYGIVRSMGSLGFAIGAYVMGVIIDATSYNALFLMQVVSIVFSIISIMLYFRNIERKPKIEEVKAKEVVKEVVKEEIKEDLENNKTKEAKPSAIKLLLKNRDYMMLIVGAFFLNAAVSLHFTYVPLLLQEHGATAGQIGTAFSLMAIAELPVIAFIRKIQKRINPSTLMIIAGIVYIFRMRMVVQFPSVQMFMIMGLLQCISFAFTSPNYIYIINNIVQREITSTAILTAFTIIFNLSSVFTMYFGGYFIDRLGFEAVLKYDWIFALIATIIFTLNFKVIKNKNRTQVI